MEEFTHVVADRFAREGESQAELLSFFRTQLEQQRNDERWREEERANGSRRAPGQASGTTLSPAASEGPNRKRNGLDDTE